MQRRGFFATLSGLFSAMLSSTFSGPLLPNIFARTNKKEQTVEVRSVIFPPGTKYNLGDYVILKDGKDGSIVSKEHPTISGLYIVEIWP